MLTITKLYPPYIEGTLPAFCLDNFGSGGVASGASITIPFTMNPAVGAADISGLYMRMRSASSGSYLFDPIFTNLYMEEEATLKFKSDVTNEIIIKNIEEYKYQKNKDGIFEVKITPKIERLFVLYILLYF